MPAKSINMHGKIYSLADEIERSKVLAQKFAQEIREQGRVAFLNPAKRKGQETVYYVYVADKSLRVSTKRNVAIETIISELNKGTDSFLKWGIELRKSFLEVQKPVELVELTVDELPKQIVKSEVILENLETPKVKIPVQKITSKKNGTKKNSKKK